MARIAFFGTPVFAQPFLQRLVQFCSSEHHELVLVVTQADQAQGRGQRLMPPPVKQLAENYGLTVLQPTTLRKGTDDGDEFYARCKELDLDVAIVVAYGKIITDRLLALPRRGFVNVHGSLLPRFRGAAPIQRAIEMHDPITGVCLMDMVKGLDEGDVYAVKTTPIIASDTSTTLFRRLSRLGSVMMMENLPDLLEGRLSKTPQNSDGLVYAHMINKSDGLLDFTKSGKQLCGEARAFDPWPCSFGFIRNKRVKFFGSFFIEAPHVHRDQEPGTILCADEFLGVKTTDGVLYFTLMQIEGKNVLPIKDAIRGFAIERFEKITQQS